MKLSRIQLRVLIMLAVRPANDIPGSSWGLAWDRAYPTTKRGRMNGNALHGRLRTLRSLRLHGLIDGHSVTDAGTRALQEYAVTDKRGVWALRHLLPSSMEHFGPRVTEIFGPKESTS